MTKDRYHHGNLREALLESAVSLIRDGGAHAISMRTVAQKAGVSRAAPYHHFKDKEALLAAVVAHGFQTLADRMLQAQTPIEDPWEKMMAIGHAYVRFATSEPMLARMMFGDTLLHKDRYEDVHNNGKRCFQIVVDIIALCQQQPDALPQQPIPFAMHAWATVQGLSSLLIEGKTQVLKKTFCLENVDQNNLVEDVLRSLLRSFRREPEPSI